MSTTKQVFKSRWGFHPCDYNDFMKLKRAHKLLLRAYCDCKRYLRWINKDPHNRKGPEPNAPQSFIETGFHQLDKHCFYGVGFRRAGRKNLYLRVLEQYRNARYPKQDPEDVSPLNLPKGFDKTIEELNQFYAE